MSEGDSYSRMFENLYDGLYLVDQEQGDTILEQGRRKNFRVYGRRSCWQIMFR